MKINHKSTVSFCLALAFGFAGQAAFAESEPQRTPEKPQEEKHQLGVGDTVPALEGVTWVQGKEVKSFDEKGKVYIVECWATWCGPCVAAIPHVNELQQKYADKGLVVVGMNVWEDGLDKVKDFVGKQGEGMSYRVAYSGGRSSKFADSWLKPAGVRGIPHAFIVKDGKIILMSHPAKINDELIDSIIAGTFNPESYAKEQAEAEAKMMAQREAVNKFRKAGDWDGLIAYAEKMDDSERMKGAYLSQALIGKSDWTALLKVRNDAKDKYGDFKPIYIDGQAVMMMESGEGAKAYAEAALADQGEIDPNGKRAVSEYLQKARLLFLADKAEDAKNTLVQAKEALAKMDDPRTSEFYGKVIDGATKALENGEFPSTRKLMMQK